MRRLRNGTGHDAHVSHVIWAMFGLGLVVVAYGTHAEAGNVHGIYRSATARWASGQDLYPSGSGFQYLPTFSFLFRPLLIVPPAWGGAVWRGLNWCLFALGTHGLALRLGSSDLRWGRTAVALIAGVVAWTAGKHGQATLAMAGLTLIALDAELRGRPWSAAGCLALAIALKPLAIVSLLLVLTARPVFGLRTAALLFGIALATLVHVSPAYVVAQWAHVPAVIAESASHTVDGDGLFHFFSLLSGVGLPVEDGPANGLRILLAILTAVAVTSLARRIQPRAWPLLIYGASVGYLLLFSHRTENNTYGILGPVVAALTVRALLRRDAARLVGCAVVIATLQTSRSVGRMVPTLGPHVTRPAVTALCLVLLGLEMAALGRRGPAAHLDPPRKRVPG